MFNWRNEILSRLGTEEWKSLMVFALGCKNLEELEGLKNEITLLKKEELISLYSVTPEEFLDYVKKCYNKNGESVDEKWKNMWLDYAKKNAGDLMSFFNNFARLKKTEE